MDLMNTNRRDRIKNALHVGVGGEWQNEALLVTFPHRMEWFTMADFTRYNSLVVKRLTMADREGER